MQENNQKTAGQKIRIVYMGTPDFAVAPLRELIEKGYDVVAVITMPDKPAGRGLKMQESAVKRYAVETGLPVLQPEKLKDPVFVEQFRALNADLAIVIAFRMLPEVIWAAPRLGTFNLHASLLPQYRGAAPINRAIMNGESRTGVTTFMLNHEIDKGDMLGRRVVEITPEDNAGTLHDKLMLEGVGLVVETVEKIASGTANAIPQDGSAAEPLREAPKIFREDCRIDWSRSGKEINDLIRGLSPYPAAWAQLEETESAGEPLTVKVFAARFLPVDHSCAAGTILNDGKKDIQVACCDGFIALDELQLAGKKRMKTDELLRGFRITETMRMA